jgi:hypothetical protein
VKSVRQKLCTFCASRGNLNRPAISWIATAREGRFSAFSGRLLQAVEGDTEEWIQSAGADRRGLRDFGEERGKAIRS